MPKTGDAEQKPALEDEVVGEESLVLKEEFRDLPRPGEEADLTGPPRKGGIQARRDASLLGSAGKPVQPFRPVERPAIAILVVCDDGVDEGEEIRLRGDRFVIGRSEGDLKIPHDGRMSSKHVEITRQRLPGMTRWVLTDLQSTNGLFVRVSRITLSDQTEFLVGAGRYRFDDPDASDSQVTAAHDGALSGTDSTKGWAPGGTGHRPPALTELIGHQIGNRLMLSRPGYWIGTDAECAICRPDDAYCEARHARLYRNPAGRWQVEHNRTYNGLWLRVMQVVAERTVRFQAGEQRFILRV